MKIFDYFKKLKDKDFEDRDVQDKPKSGKAFIAVIAVYVLTVGISCAAGFFDISSLISSKSAAVDIKMNISDIIILGIFLFSYLISHFKGKG